MGLKNFVGQSVKLSPHLKIPTANKIINKTASALFLNIQHELSSSRQYNAINIIE